MKKNLVGQIPLVGGGFYPSRIPEEILRTSGIGFADRDDLLGDAAYIQRMKLREFKEGFLLALRSGRSFFVILEGGRVSIYENEASEDPEPAGVGPEPERLRHPAARHRAVEQEPAVDLMFRSEPEALPLILAVPGEPAPEFFPGIFTVVD